MTATVLIVSDADDPGSSAVARRTMARVGDRASVILVTPAELALASWHHTIGANGEAATCVRLRDGRELTDSAMRVVLYRASLPPLRPSFARAQERDRDYAVSEMQAVIISWLRVLGGRVMNRVDGGDLRGPSWSQVRWNAEARRQGLDVMELVMASAARMLGDWRGPPRQATSPIVSTVGQTSTDEEELLVVEGKGFGALAGRFGGAGERLASAAGCRILAITFAGSALGPAVTSVTTVPALRDPGQVEVVAESLARAVFSSRPS